METIRIGIIGAGQNTRKTHIPHLQDIPGVQIIEVANRTSESGQKVAAEFNIPVVKNHWQAVATSKNIDAVVIGTWPYLHCEATCLALASGKHVLCEARMAMNFTEAETMERTARKHLNLVTQLVPSPFTLRVDKTVKNFIHRGKLGRLLYFHFDWQTSPLTTSQDNFLHWRRNIKYSGTNTMVLGIVYESILNWFGSAKWVTATGQIFYNTAINPDNGKKEKIEIPDYLLVQMELKNGLTGVFFISEAAPYTEPAFLKIYGDEGILEYSFAMDGHLRFASRTDNVKKSVVIPKQEEGHWRVEEEFINAIKGKGKISHTTFATGLEYMRFTEAVIDSFKNNGQKIEIDRCGSHFQ